MRLAALASVCVWIIEGVRLVLAAIFVRTEKLLTLALCHDVCAHEGWCRWLSSSIVSHARLAVLSLLLLHFVGETHGLHDLSEQIQHDLCCLNTFL